MIKIIYGNKGSGKTKKMIDCANHAAENSDGNIAYLYVNKKYILDLKHKIRFIDTSEYGINGAYLVLGFLNGLVASNFDLKTIYIDGFLKHMDRPLDQLEDLFIKLDELVKAHSLDLVLSISCDKEQMPEFMNKYID